MTILTLLNNEQQSELLHALEKTVKRDKGIDERIGELMEKYFDLV
jgi:hypothetical protein